MGVGGVALPTPCIFHPPGEIYLSWAAEQGGGETPAVRPPGVKHVKPFLSAGSGRAQSGKGGALDLRVVSSSPTLGVEIKILKINTKPFSDVGTKGRRKCR